VDEHSPNDVWICIDGHSQNIKMFWEQTRVIAFTAGKFGNSDPKKFPKHPARFLPLPWDEKVTTERDDILKTHAMWKAKREQILKKNADRGINISQNKG
jgi:hypothetical protein